MDYKDKKMSMGNEKVTNDRDAIEAWKEGQKHHQPAPEPNSGDPPLTREQEQELNRKFLHQTPDGKPHPDGKPSLRDSFPRDTGKSESHYPTSPSDSQSPTHKPPDMGTSNINEEDGGMNDGANTVAGDGGNSGTDAGVGDGGTYAGMEAGMVGLLQEVEASLLRIYCSQRRCETKLIVKSRAEALGTVSSECHLWLKERLKYRTSDSQPNIFVRSPLPLLDRE